LSFSFLKRQGCSFSFYWNLYFILIFFPQSQSWISLPWSNKMISVWFDHTAMQKNVINCQHFWKQRVQPARQTSPNGLRCLGSRLLTRSANVQILVDCGGIVSDFITYNWQVNTIGSFPKSCYLLYFCRLSQFEASWATDYVAKNWCNLGFCYCNTHQVKYCSVHDLIYSKCPSL
jgi:hypothetical protein